MSDYKGLLLSKTFWGAILMAAAFVWKPAQDVSPDDIVAILDHVIAAVGLILAIVGRIKANKIIKGIF
jgi:hypothetical protein